MTDTNLIQSEQIAGSYRACSKKLHRRRFLSGLVVACGLLAVGNMAFAKPKAAHHDAHKLVSEHLKHDGRHDIDKHGKYTTAVEVRGGKVAGVHVRHETKGEIPVKKYKTHRKMAMSGTPHVVYASYDSAQMEDMGTVYIGYSYIDDDGVEQIYWFPADEVIDGETGAVEYIPENS